VNGTFIVNGTERVIVSQMHRSPGVFFDHDKGKTHSSGKLLFAARIIPYRGSWLDIEFDAKDIVHARIDRRRKIPVTSLLYRARHGRRGDPRPSTRQVTYKRDEGRLARALRRRAHEGLKAVNDLVDADTGEVVVEAGKKLTARQARQLAEKGLKALKAPTRISRPLPRRGPRQPEDRRDLRRGRRRDRPRSAEATLVEAGLDELPILDIDHVNVGAYIRNTLAVDKNETREDALFDIYRVMRPGEPPTVETAEAMFHSLFFDPSATTCRPSAASR
jgi:DNA-directed RNA polymerase subunit beta